MEMANEEENENSFDNQVHVQQDESLQQQLMPSPSSKSGMASGQRMTKNQSQNSKDQNLDSLMSKTMSQGAIAASSYGPEARGTPIQSGQPPTAQKGSLRKRDDKLGQKQQVKFPN